MSHNDNQRLSAEILTLREICNQLKATDPLKNLGREVAFICHEIKNCSMVVASYASLLQKSKNLDDGERAMVSGMAEAAQKLHDFTREISDLSKSFNSSRNHIEFDILNAVNLCIENNFKNHAQKFIVDCKTAQTPVTICGRANEIDAALAALFTNAIEAGAENIRVSLRVCNRTLLIVIDDDGVGCGAERLADLRADNFFTTKGQAVSCGLGLSLVNSIIEGHGGKISIYSKNILGGDNRGLSVQISLQTGNETGHEALRSEVLIVNDGIANLPIIMNVLKNLKNTPRIAETVEAANIGAHSAALGLVIFAAPASAAQIAKLLKDDTHIKLLEIQNDAVGDTAVAVDTHGVKNIVSEEFVLACLASSFQN